jgi:5-methylcytosine-specific restriction protein A
MIDDIVSNDEPLLAHIGKLGNIAWINHYYDLVNRLLEDLNMKHDNPRLSLSYTKEGKLPLILGQRYILQPLNNERIRCIVPANFKLNDIEGVDYDWFFSRESTRDAKWIEVSYPIGGELPPRLYESILKVCNTVLKKTNKSGFRKYHSDLLYGFITDIGLRRDVLKLITRKGLLKKDTPVNLKLNRSTKAILLTWNPKRWKWDDYLDKIEDVNIHGSTIMNWSCGNSKSIQVDDRVFLMRVGPDKPGIIGSGVVVKAPFMDIHFADKDRKGLNVEVVFDTLLDFKNDILQLDILKREMPKQVWTPQASGISIKTEYLSTLEALWYGYQNSSHEPKEQDINQLETEKTFLEGKAYSVLQIRYERDSEAREVCLDKKGYSCRICDFNFQKIYGEVGKGYIHVHHIKMVKDMGEPTKTNPETDLEPVCPNCHAMLHKRNPPFSIVELKEIIKSQINNGK